MYMEYFSFGKSKKCNMLQNVYWFMMTFIALTLSLEVDTFMKRCEKREYIYVLYLNFSYFSNASVIQKQELLGPYKYLKIYNTKMPQS